jgi:hypothetical protein
MSDERDKRLESEDLTEDIEDVEAHARLAPKTDVPDVRLADDEEGDDVEAHARLAPKTDVP